MFVELKQEREGKVGKLKTFYLNFLTIAIKTKHFINCNFDSYCFTDNNGNAELTIQNTVTV